MDTPDPAVPPASAGPVRDRSRRLPRRLALATAGVLLALLAGEVLLRVFPVEFAERQAQYALRPVGDRPPTWVYEPGTEVEFRWDGDPVGVLPPGAVQRIPVNRVGLRGPLPEGPGPRVVVLGDSFTFGEGVEEADTFVRRAESLLATDPPRDGGPPRLVNAGVAGQGTVEEAARLEGLLRTFEPRAVVLVFIPNDAIHGSVSAERGRDLLNMPGTGGSRLLGLVRRMAASADTEEWYRSFYVGDRSADWERAAQALSYMVRVSRAAGARFGVVLHPLLHRLDDYPFEPIHRVVAEACERQDVPVRDLLAVFADQDARSLWAHPADRHPNRIAHGLAAPAVADLVAELLR